MAVVGDLDVGRTPSERVFLSLIPLDCTFYLVENAHRKHCSDRRLIRIGIG